MNDTRIESLFNAALKRPSPEERAAYLDGACREDFDLRSRVDTLLRAHEEAEGFLEPDATSDSTPAERPGQMIGRYKLLQQIGEGGFGVVYMAEQQTPVRRMAALKIIKLGMDTRQVVARFESERQALALMDHPHIARVLDAGATESGRPYFVMELVKGIPITQYCDQNHLTTRERIELLIPVCQAVQHAHHKGIIHRDLKPSNVLVTSHDGRPVAKVIDFGIAKATNQRLTEKTLFTEFRQFIGTPQYMSPEQAEMSGLDIDTRSDIYSLGVMLYELLTGATPFDGEALRQAGYAQMQRIIREEEPPSPSAKVSTLADQLAQVARHRNTDPTALKKVFQGDLDWIVMKAMEKDRTRRYNTANDLAEDLRRYLCSEPVQAGPPSTLYKLRKFVRRNRAAVSTGLLTTGAVLLGLVLAVAGFVRAQREARRSQEIADYLQETLVSTDPNVAAGGPGGQAGGDNPMGHLNVGKAVERARKLFGEDHATVAATLENLALQRKQAGDLDSARKLYQESLSIRRRLHGKVHVQVGLTLGRLGEVQRDQGDDDGAVRSFRESLRITGDLPGQPGRAACDIRGHLAQLLERRGQLQDAESLLRESLRIRRQNPRGQEFFIAATLEQLTGVLVRSNKEAQAGQVFRETIEAYRPLFPADSPTIAWHNAAYGIWLWQRGKLEQAEPYFREAIRIYRQIDRPPRDIYLLALDGLFQILRTREEATDEAIEVFHQCMVNIGHFYGKDSHLMAPHLFGFAKLLERRRRFAEAIPLLMDGIRISRKTPTSLLAKKWDEQASLQSLQRYCRRTALTPLLARRDYQAAFDGAKMLLAEALMLADHQPRFELDDLLAAAEYRLGRYPSALDHFLRAEAIQGVAKITKPQAAFRLSFLAMTQYRLKNRAAAEKTLTTLATRYQTPLKTGGLQTADEQSLVREARQLVFQQREVAWPVHKSPSPSPIKEEFPFMTDTGFAPGLLLIPFLSPRGVP